MLVCGGYHLVTTDAWGSFQWRERVLTISHKSHGMNDMGCRHQGEDSMVQVTELFQFSISSFVSFEVLTVK